MPLNSQWPIFGGPFLLANDYVDYVDCLIDNELNLNLSGFHFFPNFCQLSTEVRPPVLKSFNLLKQFAAEEHTEEMRLALNLFESL